MLKFHSTKMRLTEIGDTPVSAIKKHIEQNYDKAYNDGLFMWYLDKSLLIFGNIILLDILLIFQFFVEYNFFFIFLKKGVHSIFIAFIVMGAISYICSYKLYWQNDVNIKIIKKFRRKSDRQKRIAMRNFWLTVFAVTVITVVLLWYEIDVKTLHKYEL